MLEPNLKEIFKRESMNVSEGYCSGCDYLQETIEKYEIGDSVESEVDYICTGDWNVCQLVQSEAEDLQDWIQDNMYYLNLCKCK